MDWRDQYEVLINKQTVLVAVEPDDLCDLVVMPATKKSGPSKDPHVVLIDKILINTEVEYKSAWWKKVSVEPVMFLYMGSFMVSSVVQQAFFVHKACSVDLGLPPNICANISSKENEQYNKQVQVVVSTFLQYEGIASHIVPVILAFYIGAWSDKVGRKLILLLGLAGSFFYWLALILNSLQDEWPLMVVLYTATFPSALTGSSLAVFMTAISYVCDITSIEERTLRVTMLEVAYLVTMPIGVAVGSYLFQNVFERSFTLMFLVSGTMMGIAIVYTMLRLKWCTNKIVHSAPMSITGTLYDTVRVITKPRQNCYALYLRLIIFALAIYTFQRDEKNMSYLYTTLKFHWDFNQYSQFRTCQSSLYILGLLVGAPLLGRCFGLKDTVIVMIAATSHCVARVCYATVTDPPGFYAGAALGALGPSAAPVLRSIASKLVSASERGRAFSLLSVADTAVPIVSSTIYSQVYNATIQTVPSSIFWVTVFTQLLVFGCAMIIHCMQNGKVLTQPPESEEENRSAALEVS